MLDYHSVISPVTSETRCYLLGRCSKRRRNMWMHVCLMCVCTTEERRTGAPELLPKTEGSPSQGTNMTYLVCLWIITIVLIIFEPYLRHNNRACGLPPVSMRDCVRFTSHVLAKETPMLRPMTFVLPAFWNGDKAIATEEAPPHDVATKRMNRRMPVHAGR